jgi:hypothetical protein
MANESLPADQRLCESLKRPIVCNSRDRCGAPGTNAPMHCWHQFGSLRWNDCNKPEIGVVCCHCNLGGIQELGAVGTMSYVAR